MAKIHLSTEINSTIQICFDLSRSIDLHKISTVKTNENAIAGKISGLIGFDEWVTWEANHLGFRQRLTSKIVEFDRPNYFVDEQIRGIFKNFRHQHIFKQEDGFVVMEDILNFSSPFGIVGRLFDKIFLKSYLTKFLKERNFVVKKFAESDDWKKVLE
ncbi:SRPBCC family protein [Halpernia sp.]|uniref:SRPBCC family protein n=1 Tax=Halpernia sp. TaxID=2782209 RepID=UPI003A92220F